ncbi:hypothetical protein, partial [Streptomyces misionensis]|uniref:hypothetical protein n=1 Tax=Streptomyces misionensis TaxID=67331 RepID=UPI0037DA1526
MPSTAPTTSAAREQAEAAGGGGLGGRLLGFLPRLLLRLARFLRRARRPLEQLGDLHTADETRHLVGLRERAAPGARERHVGHPPPVGRQGGVPQLVARGGVRRGEGVAR